MHRYHYIFLFVLLISNSIKGQINLGKAGEKLYDFPEYEIIDTSHIECVYFHTTYDSHCQEHQSEFGILLVGKHMAKYMDYDQYIVDSLLNKVDRSTFTVNDFYKLHHNYLAKPNYMLTHFPDLKIEYHDRVFVDNYVYEDSVADMLWELVDDTLTVCGQICHKAETNFRGRKWIAWYCDIPICLGPWKFSGLPGLIMMVRDEKEEHVFEATSLMKRSTGIFRKPHTFEYSTTRKRYNKLVENYHLNPHASMSDELVPRDANGNPTQPTITRLFFNPEELE